MMGRVVFALLFALLVALVMASPAFGQLAPDAAPLPHSRSAEHITIHFAEAGRADAEAVAAFLPGALERLREHFRGSELDAYVDGFTCDIYLHSTPDSQASEAQATGVSGTTDGTNATYFLQIHVLAPSAHSDQAVTHIGEKKDGTYFERLLVHEYAAAVLDRITRSKPRGWRLYEAPRWFFDGYEEYLALVCSNEHSRTVTMGRYRDIVRDDGAQVRNDFGLSVKSPYLGGAMLVAFMYDTYGAARVHAALTSEEPTFGRALASALDVTLDSFFAAWQAWRDEERQ